MRRRLGQAPARLRLRAEPVHELRPGAELMHCLGGLLRLLWLFWFCGHRGRAQEDSQRIHFAAAQKAILGDSEKYCSIRGELSRSQSVEDARQIGWEATEREGVKAYTKEFGALGTFVIVGRCAFMWLVLE